MDKPEQEADCRKLEVDLGILKTEVLLLEKTYPLKIREAAADLSKFMAEVEHAAKANLDKVCEKRTSARQNTVMRPVFILRSV